MFEDEHLAAQKRAALLATSGEPVQVLAIKANVKDALSWFEGNPEPDLIISDIKLTDGLSFEIFKKASVKCPIIFTTAYDKYAIKAFEVHSVDYLLKPVDEKKLQIALKKYKNLRKEENNFDEIAHAIASTPKSYKSRFLVKIGQKIKAVAVEKVAYFYTSDKMTWLLTHDGKKFPLDHSLEELDQMLNPDQFFRINRKYLANIEAVREVHPYFKGRLMVLLNPEADDKIVVSADKTPQFKSWLDS